MEFKLDEQLPYEKFVTLGPENMSESELLAIIIRTGTKDKSALDISKEVLSLGEYPRQGILGLYDLSLDRLSEIKGVGPVKAVKLKALTELSMRFHKASAISTFCAKSPESVANYFMEDLRHLPNETVVLVCLDTKANMISHLKVSEGSVNRCLISPRTIFLEALNKKAVFIILLHNHPSGDPTPSVEDINLTKDVYNASKMLDILLLDHIIIGDNRYFSFKDSGYFSSF